MWSGLRPRFGQRLEVAARLGVRHRRESAVRQPRSGPRRLHVPALSRLLFAADRHDHRHRSSDNRPNATPRWPAGLRPDAGREHQLPEAALRRLVVAGAVSVQPSADTGASYTLVARRRATSTAKSAAGRAGPWCRSIPNTSRPAGTLPRAIWPLDQRHRARPVGDLQHRRVTAVSLERALQTLESGVPYGAVSNGGVNPQLYVRIRDT